MKVLSLHSLGHDSGVSYIEDGRLVLSVETERLTRVKHDHRVELALRYVLSQPQVDVDGIDLIAVSSPVRGEILQLPDLDAAMATVRSGAPHHLTTSNLLGRPVPCVVVTHEVAHAALAAHYAGHREGALILINEGRGQITRSSLFRIEGGRLQWIEKDPLPWYGNGFGWSALGFLFGFGKNPSVAGKVMALGGYGQPRQRVREIFEAVDPRVLDDRAIADGVAADLATRPEFGKGFTPMADAVATFQEMFTEQVSGLLARHGAAEPGTAIALGGGCALNIVANTQLRQQFGRDVAIPPACGDAGHPIGAAVYALEYLHGQRLEPFSVYANGLPETATQITTALGAAGLSPVPYDPDVVAGALAAGKVVAFSTGASELGPRALGNRSLLGDPTAPGMRKRLSEDLKRREWFRPLGAVMREETFQRLYPGELASPHMLFNYDVPDSQMAEARHADGTSRLQTLARAEHPALHDLLGRFEQLSGVPALINTSLNGPGRAIAHRTTDVLDDFLGQGVDLFVCSDVMVQAGDVDRAAGR